MIMKFVCIEVIYIIHYVVLYVTAQANEDDVCRIDIIKDMHEDRPPFLLCKSEISSKYIYPLSVDPTKLIFNNNQKFNLFCPGKPDSSNLKTSLKNGNNILVNSVDKPIEITCLKDNNFLVNEQNINLATLNCEKNEIPRLQTYTEKQCTKGAVYKISYGLSPTDEMILIELCYNSQQARAVWARSTIRPIYTQVLNESPDDKVYKFAINKDLAKVGYVRGGPYSLKSQHDLFHKLLNDEREVNKIFSEDLGTGKYLAQTELISHKEKFYRSEQEAAYFFSNVVPMWESLRSTDWTCLEDFLRSLINKNRREFDVWAGGAGTLKIKNKEVYLLDQSQGTRRIPVPHFIFKCLTDKLKKKGLCFLVVNEPRIKTNLISAETTCTPYIPCFSHFKNAISCCMLKDFHQTYAQELGLNDDWNELLDYKPLSLSWEDEKLQFDYENQNTEKKVIQI